MHANGLAGHAVVNRERESFGEKAVITEMHGVNAGVDLEGVDSTFIWPGV
jgi:hypothetical protein